MTHSPSSSPFYSSHPGYFGKVGMRHFHLKRNQDYRPIMNVDQLFSLLPADAQQQLLKDKSKAAVVDLTQHGAFKLLGNGSVKLPFVVKARYFSKQAEKKIKAAGGACVLVA